jgi:acyl-CoA thioester hydrolase
MSYLFNYYWIIMFTEKVMPRFSETDALGHINNTVLPVWFEAARVPIFKFFSPDLNPHNWKLIIAKVEVSFVGELFYAHEVTINTSIEQIGNSSFVIRQEAWQQDKCCAIGKTVMVRYDFVSKTKQPLSTDEKAALTQHLVAVS